MVGCDDQDVILEQVSRFFQERRKVFDYDVAEFCIEPCLDDPKRLGDPHSATRVLIKKTKVEQESAEDIDLGVRGSLAEILKVEIAKPRFHHFRISQLGNPPLNVEKQVEGRGRLSVGQVVFERLVAPVEILAP